MTGRDTGMTPCSADFNANIEVAFFCNTRSSEDTTEFLCIPTYIL